MLSWIEINRTQLHGAIRRSQINGIPGILNQFTELSGNFCNGETEIDIKLKWRDKNKWESE